MKTKKKEAFPQEAETMIDPAELRIRKKKKNRRKGCVLLALLLVLVLVLQSAGGNRTGHGQSVEVAELVRKTMANTGSITRTLQGSGVAASEEEREITVPGEIRVTSWLVGKGDVVTAGDPIAVVNQASLLAAISDIQNMLEEVDKEIADLQDSSASVSREASVEGTVVKIYASEGDSVLNIMYECGALMLLSLDDLLAVTIETSGTWSVGDEVTVAEENGSGYIGHVASVERERITVTVPLADFSYGSRVEVRDAAGEQLGFGNLFIYSQQKLTGYSGTVEAVQVEEGEEVSRGTELLAISAADSGAACQSLLQKREKLVEQYHELVTIAATGYICAEESGVISDLETEETETAEAGAWETGAWETGAAETGTAETSTVETGASGTGASRTGTSEQKTSEQGIAGTGTSLAQRKDISVTVTPMFSVKNGVSLSEKNGVSLSVKNGVSLSEENSVSLSEENSVSFSVKNGVLLSENNVAELSAESGTEFPAESGAENLPEEAPETNGASVNDSQQKSQETDASGALSESVRVVWLGSDGSLLTENLPERFSVSIWKGDIKTDTVELEAASGWSYTWMGLEPYDAEGRECIYRIQADAPAGYRLQASVSDHMTLILCSQETESEANAADSGVSLPEGFDINSPESLQNGSIADGNAFAGIGNLDVGAFSANAGVDLSGFGTDAVSEPSAEASETQKDYEMDETVLGRLTPNHQVSIDLTIDELDIEEVSCGQSCEVSFDALPGSAFAGTVTKREPSGVNQGGNTKYTVTVTLEKTEAMLPGMNVTVRIPLETRDNVLLIPEEALMEEGGRVFVYTSYDEKKDELSEPVEVTTGLSDGIQVEITDGLAPGQNCYYRYADTITYTFSS